MSPSFPTSGAQFALAPPRPIADSVDRWLLAGGVDGSGALTPLVLDSKSHESWAADTDGGAHADWRAVVDEFLEGAEGEPELDFDFDVRLDFDARLDFDLDAVRAAGG